MSATYAMTHPKNPVHPLNPRVHTCTPTVSEKPARASCPTARYNSRATCDSSPSPLRPSGRVRTQTPPPPPYLPRLYCFLRARRTLLEHPVSLQGRGILSKVPHHRAHLVELVPTALLRRVRETHRGCLPVQRRSARRRSPATSRDPLPQKGKLPLSLLPPVRSPHRPRPSGARSRVRQPRVGNRSSFEVIAAKSARPAAATEADAARPPAACYLAIPEALAPLLMATPCSVLCMRG